jgi:hypothetical protein
MMVMHLCTSNVVARMRNNVATTVLALSVYVSAILSLSKFTTYNVLLEVPVQAQVCSRGHYEC